MTKSKIVQSSNSRSRRLARAAGIALVAILAPGLLASCAAERVLEPRVDMLQAKEEIRSTLLQVTQAIDSGDVAQMQRLAPMFHTDFRLNVTDLSGTQQQFVGYSQFIQGYTQMLAMTDPLVSPGAITVEVEGNNATAIMKVISTGDLPPMTIPNLQPGQRALLFGDVRATFMRQGMEWKLYSVDVNHELGLIGESAN